MNGFHLGACAPNNDDAPAGPGCDFNCPRRLHAENERLREALAEWSRLASDDDACNCMAEDCCDLCCDDCGTDSCKNATIN